MVDSGEKVQLEKLDEDIKDMRTEQQRMYSHFDNINSVLNKHMIECAKKSGEVTLMLRILLPVVVAILIALIVIFRQQVAGV